MNLRWTRPLAGLALVGALTTGCPSPSIYGTARTIPQGTIQHTLAVEVIAPPVAGRPSSTERPHLPAPHRRRGERRPGTAPGQPLDARHGREDQPPPRGLRPRHRARRPGDLHRGLGDVGGGFLYLNLPLVLGFNLSRNFSLIATPGVAYAVVFGTVSSSSSSTSATSYSGSGFMPRLGLGANIRISNAFALQPEFTGLLQLRQRGRALHLRPRLRLRGAAGLLRHPVAPTPGG
nr:hypothetical protein [Deltaproteobacteria bacterium]